MTDHLNELQLDELAAGELDDRDALEHVTRCAACSRAVDDLRALRTLARPDDQPFPGVAELDARMVGSASEAAARARARHRAIWAGRLAAAALVILGATAVFRWGGGPGDPAGPRDVNGDGHRDILDALVVARGLASGDQVPTRWDVTGDAVIDQRDIDELALEVVALREESR